MIPGGYPRCITGLYVKAKCPPDPCWLTKNSTRPIYVSTYYTYTQSYTNTVQVQYALWRRNVGTGTGTAQPVLPVLLLLLLSLDGRSVRWQQRRSERASEQQTNNCGRRASSLWIAINKAAAAAKFTSLLHLSFLHWASLLCCSASALLSWFFPRSTQKTHTHTQITNMYYVIAPYSSFLLH